MSPQHQRQAHSTMKAQLSHSSRCNEEKQRLTAGSQPCSRVLCLWSSRWRWAAGGTRHTAGTPRARKHRWPASGSGLRWSVCSPHTRPAGGSRRLTERGRKSRETWALWRGGGGEKGCGSADWGTHYCTQFNTTNLHTQATTWMTDRVNHCSHSQALCACMIWGQTLFQAVQLFILHGKGFSKIITIIMKSQLPKWSPAMQWLQQPQQFW